MDKIEPKEKMILIVDDDPSIVQYFKIILEAEGFRTCSTTDGRGISEIVKREKVDLILFDLMMPYVGGYEGIRQLQMHDEIRNIPIFIVTAKPVNESTRALLKMEPNVADFFTKPITKPLFLQRVHQQLNTKSSDEKIVERYRKMFEDERGGKW